MLAVRFTRQYRHYLLGKTFTIRTDNASLLWVIKFRNLSGQLARWVEELSQYKCQIMHRAGKLHTNADALSRVPTEKQKGAEYRSIYIPIEELPCGGCKYCNRVDKCWKQFEDDVDYVIPLSIRYVKKPSDDDQDSSDWIKNITK